ncbi:hypothetical protein AYO20_05849 [Fonsecaea nubica]|uniref:Uncharacterized protein n=1 Tax=Fonsecaea nubica TaxID=856822 RepID=A0A178CYE6_9EURO|nr:hypothetical protein AYO20_05849 [Fonsecaea nubica]OAL34888.1 hypothetical protein AYO20_05849 [Fonsecaea nubica]
MGKRHHSARDKSEENFATDHRRKSRRIQKSRQLLSLCTTSLPRYRVTDRVAADYLRPQKSRVNSKISRKSPRSQETQTANPERTASEGQRRSSQRPALKQYPEEIPPPFISQPAGIKRKRSHDARAGAGAEVDDSQHERLAKQLRRSTPPRLEPSQEDLQTGSEPDVEAGKREGVRPSIQTSRLPPPKDQLSENNLRTFNAEMNPEADSTPVLKRTSSRRSIVPSEAGTVRSHRSANTNKAFYRHKNLQAVQIHIHAKPPDFIEAAANRIVNAKVSKQRRAELRVIAQELSNSCLKNVKAQSGEDDFINPLHTALKALGLKNLCIHEKAEWREELQPIVPQQLHFSSNFMASVQQLEVDDVSARPRKRQQQSAGEYMSPESFQANAPTTPPANNSQESNAMSTPAPPVPEKEGDRYPIENPRPDLSIGTDLTALVSALSAQKLNKAKATAFIHWLQNEMVQHVPKGPLEPMLLLVPAPRALDLAFPFAVVEGKAYSTGKQIFEAENQAAVSGACALKIQHDLDSLVNSGTMRSGALPKSSNTHPPLFFSITTQGPIHELWYHWTVYEGGVRKFESKLLDSCNVLVLERGEDFVVKLNNVGSWGTGPFVKSLVERLGKVAVKAET